MVEISAASSDLQKKFDEEGAEACMTEGTELVHVRTAGPEEHARWAERRACWRWGRYPPPGHGDGTQLALQEARGQVLLCKTPGCYSIVDMQAARRRANKDERDFFMDGDGCAGALCSARPWPRRHGRRQAATASKLGAGGKTLLLWPPSTAARRDQWAVPTSLALSVIRFTPAPPSEPEYTPEEINLRLNANPFPGD